ncbi:MAG: hypothetical protein U0R52_08405 [Solirubrobacterales bacterium]
MTVAAPEARRAVAAAGDSAGKLFDGPGLTLEEMILRAWEDLVRDGSAECPVCRGRLLAAAGCEDCGSRLD